MIIMMIKGLEYFAHVLLLSSGQDKYAPFYSARIEMTRDAVNDKKRGMPINQWMNQWMTWRWMNEGHDDVDNDD